MVCKQYYTSKYNIGSPVQRYGPNSGTREAAQRRNAFERSGALWVHDLMTDLRYPSADELKAFLAGAGYPHVVETETMSADEFISFAERLSSEHPVEKWVPFTSLKTEKLYICFSDASDAIRARLMIT